MKPVVGAKVRLRVDIHTRGNRIFRRGVVMQLLDIDRIFILMVRVRGQRHHLYLRKKDYPSHFEVIEVPEE